MKALLSKTPGPPETLSYEDVPDLVPGPGEVVIAMKAAGVNFFDGLIIEDRYQYKPPRPFAPGAEVAGIVASLGEGVTHLKPGDRVLANVGAGGFAEQTLAEAAKAIVLPDAMPFDDAAALFITYGTSYFALKNRAQLKPGETLLILGASGGVGVAAIELGKTMGARVIGAVSSEDKAAFARDAGADETIVYPRNPLSKDQRKALSDAFKRVGGGGVDVIYDAVGGDYCEPALRAMNWNGRYLVVGFPAGIPTPPLNLTLLKNCAIMGVFLGGSLEHEPEVQAQNMRELFAFYAQGGIRPRAEQSFKLQDGAKAIRALMDRKATGKLVLLVD
jgi:NADPH2:quinone reductase